MGEGFTVSDPGYQARIRDSFARQGFMARIGASLDDLGPGRCVVSLPFGEAVAQQHGFFHGGAIGSIADTAGAYAAFTLIGAEQSMLSVEYKLNFLAPAQGQVIRATGEVVKFGRTLSVSRVDIHVENDATSRLCATGLLTMMQLAHRGDQ